MAGQYSAAMVVVRRAWQALTGLSPWIVDGALVLLLTAGAFVPLDAVQQGNIGAVFAPLVPLPLLLRRRFPLACFIAQVAAFLAASQANGAATIAAVGVGAYSLGAHSKRPAFSLAATAVAASAFAIAIGPGHGHVPSISPVLLPFVLLLPAWLLGGAIRVPTVRAEAMRERALRLEREREIAMAGAAAAERSRIARELHDVVAHSVSVMVVQAGAARQVLLKTPEAAGESLLAVEASGREALRELRHLLQLLTDGPGKPSLAPQPGAGQIGSLVERLVAAGQPVELWITGIPRPLPPGLDLTIFRIVQEALTNALKHAPGARTEVALDYGDRELRLDVLDEGPSLAAPEGGTGRGLLGMRERVAIYGGSLEAGLRPGRGFAVRVRLPMEPA